MTTYTDVFERKEVKYRLNARQLRGMKTALEGRMAPDAFGRTRVISLYLDTPDRTIIEHSLEKPLYKEKLRIRSYGAPQPDGLVFIELKKKFKGIVYKRRVGCSYSAARAYLAGAPYESACARFPVADAEAAANSCSLRSLQIAAEIERFMLRHQPLGPSMFIACDRVAFAPVFDELAEMLCRDDVPPDLRITFDESIAYRDLLASREDYASLLAAGEAVMEIKSSGPFPLWLVRALDECRAYPTSFSKYGEAHRACAAARVRSAARAAPLERAFLSPASPSARRVSEKAPTGPRLPATAPPSATPRARRPRAAHAAAEEQAERLAPSLGDTRPRRFHAPDHAMKKGGRCA